MYGFKHYEARLRIVGAIAAAAIAAAALALPAGSQTHASPLASVTGSGKVTFANFPQPGVNTTEQFNVSPGASPDEIHPVEFLDKTRPPGFTPCDLPPLSMFQLDSGNYVVRPGAG